MSEPLLRVHRDHQALSRRAGAGRRVVRCRRRRDPRSARRERRRQIDAAEDPVGRPAAGRRHASSSTASSGRSPPRTTRRRTASSRSTRSSTFCPEHDGRREHVHRPRARRARFSSAGGGWPRRPGSTARIGLDDRSDDAGQRPLGRRAADGRDRPRALDEVAPDRHGRADLGADRAEVEKLFASSASCATGPRHHLRHPSAGGGDAICDRVRCCATAGGRHRHGRRDHRSTKSSG